MIHDDPAWIRQQIDALTGQQETRQPKPWTADDAPVEYIESMIKGVVGLSIDICEIEGKWKVSQNRSLEDRQGVRDGLMGSGQDAMAAVLDGAMHRD